jgi:hypothetical protein
MRDGLDGYWTGTQIETKVAVTSMFSADVCLSCCLLNRCVCHSICDSRNPQIILSGDTMHHWAYGKDLVNILKCIDAFIYLIYL